MADEERLHGVIRVTGHAEDETAYIVSFPRSLLGTIETELDAAFVEMKADKELVAMVREEYGGGTVRDLLCEMPDEPFNKRGIEFVTVYAEYVVDGPELLPGWDDDEEDSDDDDNTDAADAG